MMAAHPQLTVAEVSKIIDYILSLKPDEKPDENRLPLSGTVTFREHMNGKSAGKYILMASYLDEGHTGVEDSRLSASEQLHFIAPKIEAEDADQKSEGLGVWDSQGATLVGSIAHNSFLQFDDISFKELKGIRLAASYNADYAYAGSVEVRAGSVEGKLIGTVKTEYSDPKKSSVEYYEIPLQQAGIDRGPLFLVFENKRDESQFVMNADWILLEYWRPG